jgi:virginiamycin A acetyltransferase
MEIPNPNTLFRWPATAALLPEEPRPAPRHRVGDYTYYDDFEDVHNFDKNVKYLFDFTGTG